MEEARVTVLLTVLVGVLLVTVGCLGGTSPVEDPVNHSDVLLLNAQNVSADVSFQVYRPTTFGRERLYDGNASVPASGIRRVEDVVAVGREARTYTLVVRSEGQESTYEWRVFDCSDGFGSNRIGTDAVIGVSDDGVGITANQCDTYAAGIPLQKLRARFPDCRFHVVQEPGRPIGVGVEPPEDLESCPNASTTG